MIDIGADLQKAYNDGYKCGRLDALAELLKYIGEMGDYDGGKTKPQMDDFFRELTAEERKTVAEYIDSISIPTGVNVFDFMDDPQTCDTCKYGEDKHRYAHICNECGVGINNYKPKDEPQTERPCDNCQEFDCYGCEYKEERASDENVR